MISKEKYQKENFLQIKPLPYPFGNLGLCGPQVFSLPACPTPRSHFDVLRKVLLPIFGVIGFILCFFLLRFCSSGNLHIQKFDFPQVISHKLEHRRISYQELSRATDGFIEANLLGKGSFGSVYNEILSDGMLVAVKVFSLQNDQVVKSFQREYKILQNVRYRNLVRIITSCSNLDFKGLVFELMGNGNLEKHLYPDKDDNNAEDVCELGLEIRLDIAIDVANGMEYLHHDACGQLVHCDIKPSNVLLDANMHGVVTYFGIAKLIGSTSHDSLSSTLALKGSLGYIAPEYAIGEMFAKDLNLHKWVNLASPNRVEEVIDPHILRELDDAEIGENDAYKCLLSLLHVGLLCSKDSPKEHPTMRDVSNLLESFKKDLVEKNVSSNRSKESIFAMLANIKHTATRNSEMALNDQSSTF